MWWFSCIRQRRRWCYNDLAYDDEIGTNIINKQSYYDGTAASVNFYYDSYVRLVGKEDKQATLKCNGTVLNKFSDNTDMLVSALTADEVVFAGATYYRDNKNFYLTNSLLTNNGLSFWTLTPFNCSILDDTVLDVTSNGALYDIKSFYLTSNSFRPAVVIKSGIEITSGEGTQDKPYVIES